ncbi:MAG TPA: 50S ribosomal protein L14 [Candidatus Thalassarchaeaceae archaeon]|jgi:large subunit ribosomal protein L14|nr:50S ribosomal protein L14 [Candidatus Thalassarchaeaceae archaeon]MDP6742394.1 50S ribosomal protein L14 [Candidatus Thalassarchaeaceae archaeon]MDP7043693.1 50S ribosomal protein L14 [Candidatus Thalassarchaeaceae archaeon]DAC51155.1 MAG TPA: 50S ribosomal protein L14 [Candidatus Poseidoniales archaeon]HIH82750.1 50S ribosomal protein L14 [Candidatus Thalassarchaeaceae archaeon]|tara:strand:- start:6 stop:407 length:402 start_codon:yes stop_codon:yes gene_type:complete
MKGISGRVTRGLPTESKMNCVDNSGAKIVQLISVLKIGGVARRYPSAGVGDMINVTVRRGTPERRRQVFRAVIVRQRRPYRRADGTRIQFEDNACVLVSNERGELIGTDIKGPVSRESAERWPRIAATAKQIV